ncbi:MAG: hypothetical protein V3W44_02110 [Dehalococcoidales bacterium]
MGLRKRSTVTERKLRGLEELESGWHYGEGVPLGDSILDDAISLNREATNLGFSETDAFPGTDGEVMLTIYFDDHYLEFTLEPNGNVTFHQEKGDEEIAYQEGLSLQDAKAKIAENG